MIEKEIVKFCLKSKTWITVNMETKTATRFIVQNFLIRNVKSYVAFKKKKKIIFE